MRLHQMKENRFSIQSAKEVNFHKSVQTTSKPTNLNMLYELSTYKNLKVKKVPPRPQIPSIYSNLPTVWDWSLYFGR